MRENIGILTGGVLDAVFEAEGSEPWSSFPSLASVLTLERVHCVTSGATGAGGQNQSYRGSNANGAGLPIWIRFEFRMRGGDSLALPRSRQKVPSFAVVYSVAVECRKEGVDVPF